MRNLTLIFLFCLAYIVWICVAVRQFKQNYFLFFLFLIAGDITTFIARVLFHSGTNIFYTIFGLACIVSVQQKNISKAAKLQLVILCIVSIFLELHGLTNLQEIILLSFLDFVLFLSFLKHFILKLVKGKELNIFLICLIFYQLTAITKFLNIITGFTTAYAYLLATNVFEMLIEIFFCIFKENSEKLKIKLENLYVSSQL